MAPRMVPTARQPQVTRKRRQYPRATMRASTASCCASTNPSTGYWFGFSDGLALLLQVYGGRILRIKGLLNVVGDPLPRVLQCVQHSVYPASSLPAWPERPPYDDRRSRLVFIVRDLAQDEVVSILGSFTGQVPNAGT